MFNAPRYVRSSDVIHNDYKIPIIVEKVKSNSFKYIRKLDILLKKRFCWTIMTTFTVKEERTLS